MSYQNEDHERHERESVAGFRFGTNVYRIDGDVNRALSLLHVPVTTAFVDGAHAGYRAAERHHEDIRADRIARQLAAARTQTGGLL